ncbi:MAG: alkaline phosphatase family protein [Candidatus Rokubacteria bacterium]|nr:alkaline phosphatase family protein [Candidatus Rokubacteria bacterium]
MSSHLSPDLASALTPGGKSNTLTGVSSLTSSRVLVVGLDCAAPDLVFDQFLPNLPTIRGLMARGTWGRLESTIPPITVPAWAAMMTGKDPGVLGFYGFRNRKDYSYDGLALVTSHSLREPTVWDLLSERDRPSVVVGVPPGYPAKPLSGCLISCFLTPPAATRPASYPADLLGELERRFGPYRFDVQDFRTEDKARVLREVHEMTVQRFTVARYLLESRPWEFAMVVDMGPDRLHHGFWKYFDPAHRRYQPGHPLGTAIPDYYRLVDAQLGELLAHVGDEINLLVLSDHGAKRMDGGICINEWLLREGLLRLRAPVTGITSFESAPVDWDRTVAWGEGGYYSRIFLNVKGREARGIVAPEDYERVRDDLTARLQALTDESGRPLRTLVYKPQVIYREVNGIAPDLIALFGDLHWRSVGTLGHGTVWVFENDTGPDDANHAMHGLYVLAGPNVPVGGRRDARWDQVTPTLCRLLEIPVPGGAQGDALISR